MNCVEVRLRDLGDTYGGLTGRTKADFGHGESLYVTFLEVIGNTRLRGTSLDRVDVAEGERQNRVVRDDVLFNGSSETPEEVALSAVVEFDTRPNTYLNSFCYGFRIRRREIADPTYLAYFFRGSSGRKLVAALAQGATRYNIAKTKFLDLTVNLPPIDIQRSIVDALIDVDRQISSLEKLVLKKRAIKAGALQRLLSADSGWDRTTVGQIAEVKTGPFGSALHESDYVQAGTPIITVEHLGERGVEVDTVPKVSPEDRRRLRAYSLRAGDVVFSRVGSIDRNALISAHEDGWLFSGRLLRVRFDTRRADPAFMSTQFHSFRFREAVRSVAVGQTMPSLNTAILRSIEIDLPPLEEQKSIGLVAGDLNAELEILDQRLKKARCLKQGIVERLFSDPADVPTLERT